MSKGRDELKNRKKLFKKRGETECRKKIKMEQI